MTARRHASGRRRPCTTCIEIVDRAASILFDRFQQLPDEAVNRVTPLELLLWMRPCFGGSGEWRLKLLAGTRLDQFGQDLALCWVANAQRR